MAIAAFLLADWVLCLSFKMEEKMKLIKYVCLACLLSLYSTTAFAIDPITCDGIISIGDAHDATVETQVFISNSPRIATPIQSLVMRVCDTKNIHTQAFHLIEHVPALRREPPEFDGEFAHNELAGLAGREVHRRCG